MMHGGWYAFMEIASSMVGNGGLVVEDMMDGKDIYSDRGRS